MKKLTFLAGAALVCALVCPGCSGDGFDEMNGTPDAGNPDTPAAEGGIRTLTVGMAQFGAPGTRASFGDESDGKLPVFWDESDRIVAYETVGEHTVGHAYRLVGAGGSASGTFTYDGGQTAPASIAEIYYPEALAAGGFAVPAEQTYTPGSFDPAAHVMRASVSDPGAPIAFESLVSVACLRLTGSGEKVTSVRLDLTPSGGQAKRYTLACPGDGVELSATPTAFYIVVEGSETPCDAAFTVAVGGTETMVQKTTAAKTFAASTVVRLPVVAYAKNLYQVLDYWPNEVDPEGVVYAVTENGLHGRIISLKLEGRGRWGSAGPNGTEGFIERTNGVPSMSLNGDGLTITKELISLRKDQSNFGSDYVLFNWLYETANGSSLDGGWYAPSREELKELCLVMSGLDPAAVEWDAFKNSTSGVDSKPKMPSWDETADNRTAFSKMITDKGGVKIDFTSRHSSVIETPEDGKRVYVLQLSEGRFQEHSKTNDYGRMRPHKHF